jgi:hypothetical protein
MIVGDEDPLWSSRGGVEVLASVSRRRPGLDEEGEEDVVEESLRRFGGGILRGSASLSSGAATSDICKLEVRFVERGERGTRPLWPREDLRGLSGFFVAFSVEGGRELVSGAGTLGDLAFVFARGVYSYETLSAGSHQGR